jgi:tetratricopeptide (TPR) repeat protein
MPKHSGPSAKPASSAGLNPSLKRMLLKRQVPYILINLVILLVGIPFWVRVVQEGRLNLTDIFIEAALILIISLQSLKEWRYVTRINEQLNSGKSEDLEVIFEKSGQGFIARTRSALDFSVSDDLPPETYFVDRNTQDLISENMLGKSMVLPAVFSFDPDAPLLLRLNNGVLLLESNSTERINESAEILLEAYSYYQNDKDSLAIETLTKALAVNPKYVDALELRAYCHQRAGNMQAALHDLTEALNERARSVAGVEDLSESYLARANCLLADGKIEQAMSDIEAAIKLTPENAELYYVRATAYEQQNQSALAIPDYTRHLKLAGDDIKPEDKATVLLLRAISQQSEEATLRDLQESIAIRPSCSAHYLRACLYAREQNYAEVIEHCTKALELDPDNFEATELRAEAYTNSGNPAGAERDIYRLCQLKREEQLAESTVDDEPPANRSGSSRAAWLPRPAEGDQLVPSASSPVETPGENFAPPTNSSEKGHSASMASPPAVAKKEGTTKLGEPGSFFSWRCAFISYGFLSIFSPLVLGMTTRFGLAGFGSGLAACAALLLIMSLLYHHLARMAGGKATFRDTTVVIAWSGLLLWMLIWVPPISSYSLLCAIGAIITGITLRHRITLARSFALVILPSVCLLAGLDACNITNASCSIFHPFAASTLSATR